MPGWLLVALWLVLLALVIATARLFLARLVEAGLLDRRTTERLLPFAATRRPAVRGLALARLAMRALGDADVEGARRWSAKAEAALREAPGSRWRASLAFATLAVLARHLGELDRAAELYARAVEAAPRYPERERVRRLTELALVLAEAGRFEEAEARAGDAARLAEQHDVEEDAQSVLNHGLLAWWSGNAAAARAAWERGLAHSGLETPARVRAKLRLHLAQLAIAEGSIDEAELLVLQARALAPETPPGELDEPIAATQAVLALAKADHDAALGFAERAIALRRGSGLLVDEAEGLALAGLADVALGRHGSAEERLRLAAALAQTTAGRRRRAQLALALGDATADREHARALYEEAATEAAQARDARTAAAARARLER